MLTIIAFLITVLGSVNWLTIGLLQYDFIAGIFGYQASVFSRIIYIIFGVACAFLVFKTFKNKGTLPVFSRRNKKDLAKNIEKMQHKDEREAPMQNYAHSNVESGDEYLKENDYGFDQSHHPYDEGRNHNSPRPLFDEHFDDRGDR